MYRKAYFHVMLLAIIMLFTGCQASLPESLPDVGVKQEEINSRIRLTIQGVTDGTVKNQDNITIRVDVVTSDYIEFPYDYGVRLFTYQEDQWIEIEDYSTYSKDLKKPIILPLSQKYPIQAGFTGVSPYSSTLDKDVPLRIILVGNIIRDGKTTEEKTAGYINLTLKP